MQIGRQPLVAGKGQRPFGFRHHHAHQIGPAVAIDHGLGDLVLQGEHAFDALGSNVVALVVDEDILLAIGDHQMAILVEMADVASVEPAVLQRFVALGVVHPVTVHHQFAAHEDLAIAGDLHLDLVERRADRVHLQLGARAVAADDRAGFGLAIALQDRDADGGEKDADFRIQRGTAGHHRPQPATEFGADGFADGAFQGLIDQLFGEVQAFATGFLAGDRQRLIEQGDRQPALLLDLLGDAHAQHFKQARHHHHEGGSHFLDVARQLLQPFGIGDLAAHPDRHILPGGVFVTVAERQERQEQLAGHVAGEEILFDHRDGAGNVAHDRAMMLAHAARQTAGAAGVDDAGQILALHGGASLESGAVFVQHGRAARDQFAPVVDGQALHVLHRFQRNDGAAIVGGHGSRQQRLGQLRARYQRRFCAAVGQDMGVIGFSVGDVGRHGDGASGHHGEIGQAPFRAVFRNQHHPVTPADAGSDQCGRQAGDDIAGFAPTDRAPLAANLGDQEGRGRLFIGPIKKERDQIGRGIDARGNGGRPQRRQFR